LSTLEEARNEDFVRHLLPVIVMALAPMAALTIATPSPSSAQCANGEQWDPKGNVCRPPDAPLALPCDNGSWIGRD
jgi:hypothetical protein